MATRASSHSLQAGQRGSEQLTKSPQFRVELSTLLPAHHLAQPQPHVRFERSGAALICSKWMHPTATANFAKLTMKNSVYTYLESKHVTARWRKALEQRKELLKRSYKGGGEERAKMEIRFAGGRGPALWGPKMCSLGPLAAGFRAQIA
jgi:hypothetical protein